MEVRGGAIGNGCLFDEWIYRKIKSLICGRMGNVGHCFFEMCYRNTLEDIEVDALWFAKSFEISLLLAKWYIGSSGFDSCSERSEE